MSGQAPVSSTALACACCHEMSRRVTCLNCLVLGGFSRSSTSRIEYLWRQSDHWYHQYSRLSIAQRIERHNASTNGSLSYASGPDLNLFGSQSSLSDDPVETLLQTSSESFASKKRKLLELQRRNAELTKRLQQHISGTFEDSLSAIRSRLENLRILERSRRDEMEADREQLNLVCRDLARRKRELPTLLELRNLQSSLQNFRRDGFILPDIPAQIELAGEHDKGVPKLVSLKEAKQIRICTLKNLFLLKSGSILRIRLPADGNFGRVDQVHKWHVDLGLFYVATFLEIIASYLMSRCPFSVDQIGFRHAAPRKSINRTRFEDSALSALGSVYASGDPQSKVVLHHFFGQSFLFDPQDVDPNGTRSTDRELELERVERTLVEKARMINYNICYIFGEDGMNIAKLQPEPGNFFTTLANLAMCIDTSPGCNPGLGDGHPSIDLACIHSILEEPLGEGFVDLLEDAAWQDRLHARSRAD